MSRSVRFVLSAVSAAVLLPLFSTSASAGEGPASGRPSGACAGLNTEALSCAGGSVPAVLRPGECVLVTARGFIDGQRVLVREYRRPGWRDNVIAGPQGVVTLRFIANAPTVAGYDVLTFVGIGATGPQSVRPKASAPSAAVTVSVPHIAIYRFTVRTPGQANGHNHGMAAVHLDLVQSPL